MISGESIRGGGCQKVVDFASDGLRYLLGGFLSSERALERLEGILEEYINLPIRDSEVSSKFLKRHSFYHKVTFRDLNKFGIC